MVGFWGGRREGSIRDVNDDDILFFLGWVRLVWSFGKLLVIVLLFMKDLISERMVGEVARWNAIIACHPLQLARVIV
jgi:hypothetical protein